MRDKQHTEWERECVCVKEREIDERMSLGGRVVAGKKTTSCRRSAVRNATQEPRAHDVVSLNARRFIHDGCRSFIKSRNGSFDRREQRHCRNTTKPHHTSHPHPTHSVSTQLNILLTVPVQLLYVPHLLAPYTQKLAFIFSLLVRLCFNTVPVTIHSIYILSVCAYMCCVCNILT